VAGPAALVFLSSFLLFQVEPLIGRHLLPWFGGVPAVWNSCLVFFQVMLVASYGYAHALQRLPRQRQARVHCLLLMVSLLWLSTFAWFWGIPLLPVWRPPDTNHPALRVLALLGVGVGLPFFALGTTGPLVQAWISERAGSSTYRLYAVSNAASFLALLSYPLAVERFSTLRTQAWVWSALYFAFALACAVVAFATVDPANRAPAVAPASPRASWLLLPAAGSVLLLSTTTEMTQNVAPVPLLWVAALALYLLSLILCFEREGWYRRAVWIPLWTGSLILLALAMHQVAFFASAVVQLAAHGFVLFAGCMVAHGEMARRRPPAEQLTAFYFWTAAGSALGGLFVALLAPALFSGYWEFPLALAAVSAVSFMAVFGDARRYLSYGRWRSVLLLWALGLVVVLEAATSGGRAAPGLKRVLSTRSFFGVLQVIESGQAGARDHFFALLNGQVVHGAELTAPDLLHAPTTYHTRSSGLGLALAELHQRLGAGRSIGVLGLGVGGIAALASPGDRLRFYEINPADVRLALGEGGYFHFLDSLAPPAAIVIGDARLSLERELVAPSSGGFDLLAIDAFSGDSVPVHLLTEEAMALYLRAVRPGGILAFNVTNRHLDLARVVAALAHRFGLNAALIERDGDGPSPLRSRWMLVTSDEAFFSAPGLAGVPSPLGPASTDVLWTDQRIDLLSVLQVRL
jgi:hypothetical protein